MVLNSYLFLSSAAYLGSKSQGEFANDFPKSLVSQVPSDLFVKTLKFPCEADALEAFQVEFPSLLVTRPRSLDCRMAHPDADVFQRLIF